MATAIEGAGVANLIKGRMESNKNTVQTISQNERSDHGRCERVLSPVFVVGCERSGTTLLRLMLNAHPDIAIPHESYFIQDLWAAHPSTKAYPAGMLEQAIEIIEQSNYQSWELNQAKVREKLRGLTGPNHTKVVDAVFSVYADVHGKPRWGDKTPCYVESLEIIQRIFPEARIIHIIRDGRAVCETLLKQNFGPRSVIEAAKLWVERVNRGHRVCTKLPRRVYTEIRYEELVTDPRNTLEKASRFIGIEFHPDMLTHWKGANEYIEGDDREGKHRSACSPLNPGLRDQWKQSMPRPKRLLFQGLAGGTLRELGYAVEPDIRQIAYSLWVYVLVAWRGIMRIPWKMWRSVKKQLRKQSGCK